MNTSATVSESGNRGGVLARLLEVRRGEWSRLALSFIAFFCLLSGYFMLRPIRGAVSSAHAELLPWLYSATFVGMLVLVPLFGWMVARFPRRRFVPAVYVFVLICLTGFALAFRGGTPATPVQLTFYVWLSVVNLLMVSVFWSLMADTFRAGQGQRLFGIIAAGGTLGALIGPALVSLFAERIGAGGMMTVALTLIALATALIMLIGGLGRGDTPSAADGEADEPLGHEADAVIGGSIWEGALRVLRSRYLLYLCLLMLLHNLVSTFLFNGMATLVGREIPDFDAATRFFGILDLLVQAITFGLQFFITVRLVRVFGMQPTLALVPGVLLIGLLIVGSGLTLTVFAGLQVAQRAMNYGILGPAKEMLFTVVDRETKYKCKNFIDTAVYRGSDVTASWLFKGLMVAGLSISQMAWVFAPLTLIWMVGVWRLGGIYQRLLAGERSADPAVAPAAVR